MRRNGNKERPRRGSLSGWLMAGFLLLLGLGYWLLLNLNLLQQGMLSPDFGLIREAIAVNFRLFPLGFGALGVCLLVLVGFLPPRLRGSMTFAGASFSFAALMLALLGCYALHFEPQRLVVREVTLHSSKIREPIRLLHFSDLQAGRIGRFEQRVFEKIESLQPDLVIHTGDWLQPTGETNLAMEVEALQSLIEPLSPEFGFFSIYGDSDARLSRLPLETRKALKLLGPEPVRLTGSFGELEILGLSLFQSHRAKMGAAEVDRWLAEASPEAFHLLLGHAPDFILLIDQSRRVDLTLAGHTHGGQVRLPLIGALVTQSGVPPELVQGFLPDLPGGPANVSSGVGCVRHDNMPRLRFNCPPELVLIHLRPTEKP